MTATGRRPYRVVFTAAQAVARAGGVAEAGRRGVIVARDAATAHREASIIDEAGGWAEVRFVPEDGESRVLAVYGQDAEPRPTTSRPAPGPQERGQQRGSGNAATR